MDELEVNHLLQDAFYADNPDHLPLEGIPAFRSLRQVERFNLRRQELYRGEESLPVLEVYEGASLATVRVRSYPRLPAPTGKRGLAGFSDASRRRLKRTFAKVRRDALPVFVTLTYPGEYPSEAEAWKVHLDTFLKRLRRRWPGSSGIWKLEFQSRGAPHYHLMLWGLPGAEIIKLWVSRNWYEVVGSGDERHLRAGTRCEALRSIKGGFSYVSKYMSKEERNIQGVGRWWGVYHRGAVPWGSLRVVRLIDCEAFDLRRMALGYVRSCMRRAKGFRGKIKIRGPSFTWICHADFWISKMDDWRLGWGAAFAFDL